MELNIKYRNATVLYVSLLFGLKPVLLQYLCTFHFSENEMPNVDRRNVQQNTDGNKLVC